MSDLISRQAAIEAMSTWEWQDTYLPVHFKQLLEELPSAEKMGRWFDVGSLSCRCDQCGCKNNNPTNYCPHCGAKMEVTE